MNTVLIWSLTDTAIPMSALFLLNGHYGLSDTLTDAMILDGGDGARKRGRPGLYQD